MTQRGFSLIEVLVAMAILGFGLLGMAVLQVNGMQVHREGLQQAVADELLNDMTERLISAQKYAPRTTPVECVAAANCDADAMRSSEILAWTDRAEQLLPGGDAGVLPEPGTDNSYLLRVEWIGNQGTESASRSVQLWNTP